MVDWFSTNGSSKFIGERIVSINGTEIIEKPHLKNELWSLPHTTVKTLSEMGHRLKHELKI